MTKTYTSDELNEILNEKCLCDFQKEVINFKDDMWNSGFGEGYKKGFEAGLIRNCGIIEDETSINILKEMEKE